MNKTAADVTALLETRLSEVRDEAGRVERALGHLTSEGDNGGSPRATPNGQRISRRSGRGRSRSEETSRGSRKGKRAARGQRQDELLKAIGRMGGAGPNELAVAIGIGTPQVYGLLRQAEGRRLIRKNGQGFEIVEG